MYDDFINSITKLLKENELWNDDYNIIPNPKKSGQSFCFFIFYQGEKKMVAKFFDYLKGLNSITSLISIEPYNDIEKYMESLSDSSIPYEIDNVNEIVYYFRRSFERYIEVTNKTSDLFPKVFVSCDNVKIYNSFWGLLIEEAIDGETLESKHKNVKLDKVENVKLSLSLLCNIGKTIKKYTEYGLVHRDLSPDNIMVSLSGKFIVIDPGTIKIINRDSTNLGYIMGKEIYASPEQYYGKARDADFSSDVYSLGIICYEMLTGVNLIEKYLSLGTVRPHDMILSHLDRDIEDLFYEFCDESDEKNVLFYSIIKKMLQVERIYRFETVYSFLEAISTLGGD